MIDLINANERGHVATNKMLKDLGVVWWWCLTTGIISGGVAHDLLFKRLPKAPEHGRTRKLSDDEYRALFSALRKRQAADDLNQDALNAIELIAMIGTRKGEILSLRWDRTDDQSNYVDRDAGLFVIQDHKTARKARTKYLVIPQEVQNLLTRIAERNPTGWLFPSPNHHGRNHLEDADNVFGKVCETAGIEDATLHDLKRSWVSKSVLGSGNTLEQVQKAIGNVDGETLRKHYLHLNAPEKAAVVNRTTAAIAEFAKFA
jgi:integrase